MEKRTALVTGGSGYLGSFLCKRLKKEGWDVILYDIKPPLHTYCDTIIIDDILNRNMVQTVFQNNKIDVVFHLAGRIEVGLSFEEPTKFWEVNVGGTLIVLDAMKNHGCDTIFFSSTAGVYFCGRIPVDEDECTIDNSVYSNTKLCCERAIEDSGLNFVIFRYFNLAGADDDLGENHEPETHLIPLILGNLNNVTINGDDYSTPDGTCVRDYVHVLDVVDAHIEALNLEEKNILVNLGSGVGYSNLEVVQTIEKITGEKVNYKIGPRREGDPDFLVANINLAKKLLNYEPKHDIESIIKTAYAWQKKRTSR
jgi:UDP-glucose 4-epimerase